jgi:hypothetical protein
VGETEYQFGFGNANDPMRDQSPVLEITYTNPNPTTDLPRYSLASGYTISMYVQFDSACHDPVPDSATDLNWQAAGCSLLQYSTEEVTWKSFECGSRRFNTAHAPSERWRLDEANQHLFINFHDLEDDLSLRHSKDLNACGPACRDAGYPLMEMGYVRNSESLCKCFHVIVHEGQLANSNCDSSCASGTPLGHGCVASDIGTCQCGGYARASWYPTTDAFTLGIGVRNGKIYFGDNALARADCAMASTASSPCVATGSIPLFTAGDNYNDGEFHHVVVEYSALDERMRLAVSKSDGSGYEFVERNLAPDDAMHRSITFDADRNSRSSRWILDWAANPLPAGNGMIEEDVGVWTMNAGGNGGFAGANMHSIRAYEGAHMDNLLDATENPPPQPATSQGQCGCTLYNPPEAPPSPSPPPPPPPPPPVLPHEYVLAIENTACYDYENDYAEVEPANACGRQSFDDDCDPNTNLVGMTETQFPPSSECPTGCNFKSHDSIAKCGESCDSLRNSGTFACNMFNAFLQTNGVLKCNMIHYSYDDCMAMTPNSNINDWHIDYPMTQAQRCAVWYGGSSGPNSQMEMEYYLGIDWRSGSNGPCRDAIGMSGGQRDIYAHTSIWRDGV